MAAKRIAKSSIDWTKFAEIVPKSETHFFNAFKAKSDGYLRRMLSYPETAPQIDWSYYKKNITNKSVVDQLESSYKTLNITYPKDTLTDSVDAQEKTNEGDVQQFIADSNLTIAQANQMLEKFKLMLPIVGMSCEEFALTFPDWQRSYKVPSWWPHEHTTPGLSQKEREEILKPDPKPYSLI